MPGAVFLHDVPTYQGVEGEGMPSDVLNQAGTYTGSHMAFIVWLAILGLVIPGLILGGLKVGGFQFIFRTR
jgi:hypothetical protein